MDFPDRLYTEEEVQKGRSLIEGGYRHNLKVRGDLAFRKKVREALKLVRIGGYLDFLKTYIRCVEQIDGLTQLRQAEAMIWANDYAVRNPVDAASVLIQKASQMREYLESKLYYGGAAEKRSDEKRIEFLETLKRKTRDPAVAEECERLLRMWHESSLAY